MPSKAAKSYGSKQLTEHLRAMAAEATEMTAEGDVLTRGEALALLLWNKALGHVEKQVDDEGQETVIVHEPASWAMQLVYDRLEGKTPQSAPEDERRVKAADAVRDLAKARLNRLTEKVAASPPAKSGPPSLKKRRKDE